MILKNGFFNFWSFVLQAIVPFSSCKKQLANEGTLCCGTLKTSLSAKLSCKMASGNNPATKSLKSTGLYSEVEVGVLSPQRIFISKVYPAPYKFLRCCVDPRQLIEKNKCLREIINYFAKWAVPKFSFDHDSNSGTQSVCFFHGMGR